MFKKLAGIGVVALAIAAGLFGIGGRSSEPAHAAPIKGLVISQKVCFFIGTAFGGGVAGLPCTDPNVVSNLANPSNLQDFANALAHRPIGDTTLPSYADFAGIDLDRNMMHERDGTLFV